MISWIQKYFQHHFRLIFSVLLAVIIVAFVFTIGAAPGIGNAERQTLERRVFGYNLGSQEDQARLFGDAALSAQLQTGYSPDNAELQEFAFERAAALQLAGELHIPAPSQREIADFIKTLRVFTNESGEFDAQRYTAFRDSLKTNPNLNESSVSRVLGDELRISAVQRLLAGPGYVLSSDIKRQLEQADSRWTLGVATVDYASYNPNIPTSDAALTKFFEENSFRYEIPPRIDASYVDLSAQPLLPTITVTDTEVRAFYDSNPARFPKPAGDAKVTVKSDPLADFAAVRPQVEAALKLERARRAAIKAASDFTFAIFQRKLAPGTPAFDAFLADQKITLKPLAPFTREQGPAELGRSPEVAAEAFKLGPDRLYSDAIAAPGGAVVLFWKELLPVRKPSLVEVREKVAADYVENEKRKRFVELGRTLRSTIEARVKSGDTFEKAATAAASAHSVKIESKMLAPFTRRQPPQDMDYSIMGALERLEKGQVSEMILAREHGSIVYAADKVAPDLAETTPQFAAARTQLAMATGRVNATSYLNEIVAEELKKSEPPLE
jgi:peptidyl-prolyl cis-trans isomerase D